MKIVYSACLIKVRFQEMHPLAILQQPRPVFLLQLLLPELENNIPTRVMRLAVLRVDFLEED